MNDENKQPRTIKYPWVEPWVKSASKRLFTLWLLMILGFVLTIGIMAITGRFPFYHDAEVIEFAICLDKTYQPTKVVPINTERFYVCGVIEGTTRLSASLTLFREGEGIYGESFSQKPGYFYMPIELNGELIPGDYMVNLMRAKKELATTDFSIFPN